MAKRTQTDAGARTQAERRQSRAPRKRPSAPVSAQSPRPGEDASPRERIELRLGRIEQALVTQSQRSETLLTRLAEADQAMRRSSQTFLDGVDGEAARSPAPREFLPVRARALQVLLTLAALAALIIIVGLFGDAVAAACLVAMAIVSVVTAPAGLARGAGWWSVLAVGTVLSVAGALIANTLGGLLAVIGGVLVVCAALVGFSAEGERLSAAS